MGLPYLSYINEMCMPAGVATVVTFPTKDRTLQSFVKRFRCLQKVSHQVRDAEHEASRSYWHTHSPVVVHCRTWHSYPLSYCAYISTDSQLRFLELTSKKEKRQRGKTLKEKKEKWCFVDCLVLSFHFSFLRYSGLRSTHIFLLFFALWTLCKRSLHFCKLLFFQFGL